MTTDSKIVKLSAVAEGTMWDDWNGVNTDVTVLTINGEDYMAYVDPSDGYRSYSAFTKVRNEEITITFKISFPPQEVLLINFDESDEDEDYPRKYSGIRIVNPKNNKIILEVGTDYSDDYYPIGICNYSPENF